jgi:predicted O-methyltransferase YrrM
MPHAQYAARTWARTRRKRELLLAVGRKLAAWRLVRVRNGHYYSPVPSVAELRRDAARIFDRRLRTLPGLDLNEAAQLELLPRLAACYADQPFPETPREGTRYFFDNYWYGPADALFLHAILRTFQPRRIIEIGSGFSSAVMLDTNERFLDRRLELTFVEPESDRLRKLLKPEDESRATILGERIQQLDPSMVDALERNDILFVDSSHVSKAGSDVNHILFELLPRLAPGVLVHFHDVLYPFEYPQDWFELGISWNEPYLLRSFLQFNRAFSILLWNDYVRTFHADTLGTLMPRCLDRVPFGVGGSLWLQRTDVA